MSGKHLFAPFLVALLALAAAPHAVSQPKPASATTTPETARLNQLWDDGLAAGNQDYTGGTYEDWYRNRDEDHANIVRSQYPQLLDYGIATKGFETNIVNAGRNIIGNASLGYNGMWGMTRNNGMSSFGANALYNQYRANQHYFYPAVNDVAASDVASRDLGIAMFPYASQSVGKSGSELDEVRKFVHTMAAFKPEVKTLLTQQGLLIPTLQMIWRRTRVASDAEYLTGLAHPTAFDNVANNLEMVNMANEIETTNIPPLAMLTVVEENYGGFDGTKYNEFNRSEQRFTTPCAIARVFYGIEKTKRMVIDAGASIDANGLPLTYHFVILRGDPATTRITPLNEAGSQVEIQIDHQGDNISAGTVHPSGLVVIGVFVHNGHYYSAPSFITSLQLFNETRSYGTNGLLKEITYNSTDINHEVSSSYVVSYSKSWTKDIYQHDFNGRLAGWTRDNAGAQTFYDADGFLIRTRDASGRPATVSEVSYSFSSENTTVAQTYADNHATFAWRSALPCIYQVQATPLDTPLTVELSASVTAFPSIHRTPRNGTVTLQYASSGGSGQGVGGDGREGEGDPTSSGYTYTPKAGFVGVDYFSLKLIDSTAQTGSIYKVRVVVGPADMTAPAAPTALKVTGLSGREALLSWPHTSDNYEVQRYAIYRDGALLGNTYYATQFIDRTATPGETYDYVVSAIDDAGNESTPSPTANGGGAAIWGQDDFQDGNYATADPALENGLAWTLVSGVAGVNGTGKYLAVGTNASEVSLLTTTGAITPPFIYEVNLWSQYTTQKMGPVLLYQDPANYYFVEINREYCGLFRLMDGVETEIGRTTTLKMQHNASAADFRIEVSAPGGVLVFKVIKSNWTVSPNAVSSILWSDTDAQAVALFGSGKLGFVQPSTGSYNVGRYDNVMISQLTGLGPDIDDDGLPDAWEEAYFGSRDHPHAAPDQDSDGDGENQMAEFMAGTDPTKGTSLFTASTVSPDADTLTITWPSAHQRTYSLLRKASLDEATWESLPGESNIPATPPLNTLEIDRTAYPDGHFFQIQVNPM